MIALEEAIDFAKKQSRAVVESGEEHLPIMLAFTPTNMLAIHLHMFDKDTFKQVIGELLRQLGAYAYIFINEAWVATLPKDSLTAQRVLNGDVSVSELPPDDRDEMLVITVAENRKSCRGWFAKILYTREGERFLGEWKELDGIADGRLILKEW